MDGTKHRIAPVNPKFRNLIEPLEPTFRQLMEMAPVKVTDLPKDVPASGVYLFTENGEHLYVGRSDHIRTRLRSHVTANHQKCAFAFLLARRETGKKADYRRGAGSRKELVEDPMFRSALDQAIARIREMDVRYVAESHPLRQGLLEMYVHVSLDTPHNDFGNH